MFQEYASYIKGLLQFTFLKALPADVWTSCTVLLSDVYTSVVIFSSLLNVFEEKHIFFKGKQPPSENTLSFRR